MNPTETLQDVRGVGVSYLGMPVCYGFANNIQLNIKHKNPSEKPSDTITLTNDQQALMT